MASLSFGGFTVGGWTKLFRKVGKPIHDVSKSAINVVTGGAVDRMDERTADLKRAELEVKELEAQAKLTDQKRRIEKSAAERNADIASRQMDQEARSINAQSRAGAIEKFQAESAGEERLAAGGMQAGSSPYMALETQLSEASKKINSWFADANERLAMEGMQAGGALEIARFNERSDTENASLLRQRASLERSSIDDAWDSFVLDSALDIGAGLLSTGLQAYSLGSSIAGIKTASKMAGSEFGDTVGRIFNAAQRDSSSLFQLGGSLKYGAATGDSSALLDLFKPGGAFGEGLPSMGGGPLGEGDRLIEMALGPYPTAKLPKQGPVSPIMGILKPTPFAWPIPAMKSQGPWEIVR